MKLTLVVVVVVVDVSVTTVSGIQVQNRSSVSIKTLIKLFSPVKKVLTVITVGVIHIQFNLKDKDCLSYHIF